MLKNIPIRVKITLAPILLLAMVSIFIYTYYPEQQKRTELEAIQSKIRSISNMFSIGVGIGMGETDLVAVSEAVSWAQSDSSVVLISVVDQNGLEIADFNPSALVVPDTLLKLRGNDKVVESDRILYYKSVIEYQDQPFGTLMIGYSLKHLDAHISDLKTTTLYFCLAVFTIGVFLSIIISNRITGNIRVLGAAVKALSSGADNSRVRINSNDEIGKLAMAFNEMVENLRNSRNELISHSKQLEKQNQELNQFSYVVSHDLKAPLRAIFKLSEWIEEDLGSNLPEGTKKNMQMLRGRVFRMEKLINGLLEYAKIGRVNILPEKVNTRQLVNEIVDLLNPPPHYTINISDVMPELSTKRILLYQVFFNLIENAVKYNDKEQPVINISALDLGAHYEFTVEDNGAGIDPAFHEKVFVIFQTLEARDKVEGTGVGLAIIKKCVEDMGGTIRLESEAIKGSKFIFTWPKENAGQIRMQKNKQMINN